MRFKKVEEVLIKVGDFHGRLGAYYGRLSEAATEPRVKMLLSYRSRREAERQQSLVNYLYFAKASLRDAWVECERPEETLAACEDLPPDPDLTIAGVTKLAMDVDLCLLQFYADLAARSESISMREMFTRLIERQVGELHNHARNAQDAEEL